jgi:hypothetical protein
MAQKQDLEAAAAAGVISADQVEPLAAFLASRAAAPPLVEPKGEEELRFIRNFHDVFLSIGIAIFAVGMVLGGFVLMGGEGNALGVALVFALAAAAHWGLAEVFAKRRRLFLPSIVLCLAFVGFLTAATGVVTAREGPFDPAAAAPGSGPGLPAEWTFLISTAAAAAATGAFWARFRLPFAVGQFGFLLALTAFFGLWVVAPKLMLDALPWWSLLSGIGLFAVGVWFDAQDPERRTLLSDNGFWLHFAAAPLILNGALSLATGGGMWVDAFGPASSTGEQSQTSEAAAAGITLAVVVGLGAISLLINRRALIVSALVTTGVSIAVLMDALGLEFGGLAAATLLVLGGVVLLLGAGWHSARRALLGWVKPDGFWARIFPPEAAPE